tara:strand:- start:3022 stop:3348 length:327 start_codon:yes stop_codon:yes gene_type:complete
MTWENVIKRESYPAWKRKKLLKIAKEHNYEFFGGNPLKIDDNAFDRWVDDLLDMFGHWYHESMRTRHPTEEQTKHFGWTNEASEKLIEQMKKAFNELQKLVPSKMKRG